MALQMRSSLAVSRPTVACSCKGLAAVPGHMKTSWLTGPTGRLLLSWHGVGALLEITAQAAFEAAV